jgi:hypothetical protein
MKPVSLKFTDRTQDQIAELAEHYETTNTDIILSAIENLLDAHDAGTLDNAQQTRKSVAVRYPEELLARMRDAVGVYGYSSLANVVEAAIDYALNQGE